MAKLSGRPPAHRAQRSLIEYDRRKLAVRERQQVETDDGDVAAILRRVIARLPRRTRREQAVLVDLAVALERLKQANSARAAGQDTVRCPGCGVLVDVAFRLFLSK